MITDNDLNLVNVSDLNQYLYCARRLYYLMFYKTQGLNYYLADGRSKHKNQSRRGGWYREIYLKSEKMHMHGKIDIIEGKADMTPIERKLSAPV
ncbi:MAG: Dna2/Cas4 domain-containing protein [Candidatus Methanoperedens sp.]|nr:Dna2/Cas4 domain-containing protein [Candidatus Methanoperedens sp.]